MFLLNAMTELPPPPPPLLLIQLMIALLKVKMLAMLKISQSMTLSIATPKYTANAMVTAPQLPPLLRVNPQALLLAFWTVKRTALLPIELTLLNATSKLWLVATTTTHPRLLILILILASKTVKLLVMLKISQLTIHSAATLKYTANVMMVMPPPPLPLLTQLMTASLLEKLNATLKIFLLQPLMTVTTMLLSNAITPPQPNLSETLSMNVSKLEKPSAKTQTLMNMTTRHVLLQSTRTASSTVDHHTTRPYYSSNEHVFD